MQSVAVLPLEALSGDAGVCSGVLPVDAVLPVVAVDGGAVVLVVCSGALQAHKVTMEKSRAVRFTHDSYQVTAGDAPRKSRPT